MLKLSGEALAEPGGHNVSALVVDALASEIADVWASLEVDVAVVVGGGNIWRGMAGSIGGMDRAQSDHMGMLATVINALALQDALERRDVPTRVMTAIGMAQIAEPYIRRRAVRHLEKGPRGDLRGRYGQPVLHNGYRCGAACRGSRRRCRAEGHPFGRRRCLYSRSPDGTPTLSSSVRSRFSKCSHGSWR